MIDNDRLRQLIEATDAASAGSSPYGHWSEIRDSLKHYRGLRDAIIAHRRQKADDRCIEDDDALYAALGDGIKCDRRVGCQLAMIGNCIRFIQNRTEGGQWRSYAELEEALADARNGQDIVTVQRDRLEKELKELRELPPAAITITEEDTGRTQSLQRELEQSRQELAVMTTRKGQVDGELNRTYRSIQDSQKHWRSSTDRRMKAAEELRSEVERLQAEVIELRQKLDACEQANPKPPTE